jgi:hypothetical protein
LFRRTTGLVCSEWIGEGHASGSRRGGRWNFTALLIKAFSAFQVPDLVHAAKVTFFAAEMRFQESEY